MMRSLYKIYFLTLFAMVSPCVSGTIVNTNLNEIPKSNEAEISFSQNILHITGGVGQVVYIYNVTGVCVMSMRVDSNDKRFDLNLHRGCYIVKVGKTVRKISVY